MRRGLLRNILQYVQVLLIAGVLGLGLRVFFMASFSIPSSSMEPALLPGDKVLVYKMLPGPRIFTHWNVFWGGKVAYKRLRGFRPLKRGEVAVFNRPYTEDRKGICMDFNTYFVKRCVGLPGDTLRIIDGQYHITQNNSCVVLNNSADLSFLHRTPDSVFAKQSRRYFPHDSLYSWNIKSFGPLYIPRTGDILQIDFLNFPIYKSLVEFESGQVLSRRGSAVLLGADTILQYVVCKNWYFMGGDNILNSNDSRYWGLVPEDFFVGKVGLIWFSKEPNSCIRLSRFFKRVK